MTLISEPTGSQGRHAADPAPGDLTDLAGGLTGRLVTSADADWDAHRMPWNVVVDQQPAAIVVAAGADDVVTTVRYAAAHGLAVAAQPGGHGASRASDGTILLRTGALDDIWIDADARVARVGAGVKWGALQAALDGTGLSGLVGSNPDVTVVGLCLGGGIGWLGRAFGRGSDAVRSFEVVDAEGQHRWVTDASDPDLMWALRGGGGDLAVVTAVELDLFPVPELAAATLAFPGDAAASVLRAFAAVTRTAPRELTLWANLMHLPDAPFVPEPMRGQSFAMVTACFLGDADALDALVAPLREAGPVLRDEVRAITPGQLGMIAEEPVDPTPAVMAGTLLHTLDDAAVDALLAQIGVGTGTVLAGGSIRHLGGALAERRSSAVAGPIAEPYSFAAMGIVPVPELAGVVDAQLDAVVAALGPWSTGRSVLTFLDRGESMARCYDGPLLARLRAVKAAVDPDGVVRSNRPIPQA
ncbi:FAD-binding oxidoreductase [Actinotalea fermentans]|uniref:FAD-linked oxidase n=1 Tax=Actinotalea fermentans TaxID=43671 RepID=A0A511YV99_9CELL|nr:FAD-binding oxidoreductase [Actinotalea fermentans]GEN79132.1 FAD-linked oxidase [Actinotalea fermentans]